MAWTKNSDGTGSKTTNSPDSLKMETISSTAKNEPHEHKIVKVDKPSGSVKEIVVGANDKGGLRK